MSNAIYWDRRAGTDVARPYPYAKWALLAEEVVRGSLAVVPGAPPISAT